MLVDLDALLEACLEIRRVWQGPGPRSHEAAAAVTTMLALLPEEGDHGEGDHGEGDHRGSPLRVQVRDSMAVQSRFGDG